MLGVRRARARSRSGAWYIGGAWLQMWRGYRCGVFASRTPAQRRQMGGRKCSLARRRCSTGHRNPMANGGVRGSWRPARGCLAVEGRWRGSGATHLSHRHAGPVRTRSRLTQSNQSTDDQQAPESGLRSPHDSRRAARNHAAAGAQARRSLCHLANLGTPR